MFQVPNGVVKEQTREVYLEKLKAVAAGGAIMTQAQRDDLARLQVHYEHRHDQSTL